MIAGSQARLCIKRWWIWRN